ncbi:hypothetical protein ACOSQ2_025324 [Xanthoceras sorbifolium]
MGIDAKCIGGFLWKVTRVSMKFCYTCVIKYPYVAGVLLVLFLLYMFLPSLFWFLIYSSPIVILVTVSIQIYFKIKYFKIQNAKRNEEKPSSVESKPVTVCRKGDKPIIHKQLSRRRNFKQNIELGTDLNDASIDDNQKEVNEGRGIRLVDRGESSGEKAFDAQSVQAQGDLVGKTSLNEGKSEVFIAEKGIGLLDGGEIAGLVTSTARNVGAVHDDLKGKISLNEEKSKGIVEEKGDHSLYQGESSSRNIQALDQPSSDHLSHYGSIEQSGNFSGGGSVGEAEVESSEGEDDDDEEEAQRDGNKAVEWTEDDQQNLMDLGDSELERNKRLESLIAKRKARKFFKMAIEKKLMESGNASAISIPPIFTLRNNLLNVIPNSLDESLPMPGSAPSVLLPTRNPFDLPYDPFEEKPNLMADSFQQEFMAAQQKEVLFCRHESFCLGPSLLPESQQDQHGSRFGSYGTEKRNEEGHKFSRFRSHSYMSCHDQLIDELLFQEEETLSRNISATDLVKLEGEASKTNSVESEHKENHKTDKGKTRIEGESMEYLHDMETDSGKDSTGPCSLASSEASELSFSSNIPTNIEILEANGGKFPQRLTDRVQSSLTFSVPNSMSFDGPSYESSPSGIEKPRLGDHLFYREKGPCHSPGYSIASDLQVEVSEVGSPPFTVDGTASPADAESLYDGDIDKDITSGSEEMWGTPCHLAGVEENELRSMEVNEVSEDDIVEVGFSAINQNLEDPPIASSKLPEEVAAKDLPPENDQEHSKNLVEKVSDNIKQVAEEVQKSSQSSDALSSENPEKAILLMKDSAAHPPHELHSDQKPEEPSESPEKFSEEVKVINNVGDQVDDANDDKAKLESIGQTDDSAQILIKQEATNDPSQPAEISTSESSKYTDNNSDKPAENQTSTEFEKKIEDIMNLEPIEGEPGKISEHEDVGGTSNTIEEQEGNDMQSITEVGVNQRFDSPIISALESELVAEQFPTDTTSSSSPRSVLPGNITTDQIPSSSFDQLVHHIDVPRSIVDDIFRNNSLDEESLDGLTTTTSQNLQQLLVDQTDHPTSTSIGSGKSEEPFVKVVEGSSESSISPEAAAELSEPADGTHPRSVDHIEGKSTTELEAGISPAKPAEEIDNSESDVPGTRAKEEETSQKKSTSEANVDNIISTVVDEEKLKSAEGSQGQYKIDRETSGVNEIGGEATSSKSIEDGDENKGKLTENKAIIGTTHTVDGNEISSISKGNENIINLPKPASPEGSLEIIEDSQSEPKNMNQDEIVTAESAARKEPTNPPGKYTREATTNNIKNPFTNVNEDKEKLKSLKGSASEGESDISNSFKDPVISEKEDKELKSVEGDEGESIFIKDPAINEKEDEEKLKSVEDSEGEYNITNNIIDQVVKEKEDEEKSNSVKGSEGESHISMTEVTEEQLKVAEPSASKSIEDGKENKGKLTENEAIVVPLNSVDGNESLNVSKGSEDVKDRPKPANSESSFEAIEDSQGESEKSEYEPTMKPAIPASGTAEEKEPSDPLQQKSEKEVDVIHNVNETAANEMSNNQNLIQQENAANQPTLGETNDSLNTEEVTKGEQNNPHEDNIKEVESTNHSP